MEAENLVLGNPKAEYAMLRDYCFELQRSNPGTTVKIEVEPCSDDPAIDDQARVFKRVYCCLGPLKEGFKDGCRPILALDGTSLQHPYKGHILAAVGIDANNRIYPFAYAVAEAENMSSWEWFLQCLGDDLELTPSSNFCFISDGQKGLIPIVAKVFPAAEHRFCVRQLWEEFKKHFKGLAYRNLLWKAASATNIPYFEKAMNELKSFDQVAWEWLNTIPARHWSKSHYSLFPRSDITINNLSKAFFRKVAEARSKPIITCLEVIKEFIMKRITMDQKEIAKCEQLICPTIQSHLESIKKEAAVYRAIWYRGTIYEATSGTNFDDQCVVDIQKKSCSCRKWDVSGIPCKHAVRAIWASAEQGGDSLPENWVDDCFKLATLKRIYSHTVNPIKGVAMWAHVEAPYTILPPFDHHESPSPVPNKPQMKSVKEIASEGQDSKERQSGSNDGKVSRAGGNVACEKCGNPNHDQWICIPKPMAKRNSTSCETSGDGLRSKRIRQVQGGNEDPSTLTGYEESHDHPPSNAGASSSQGGKFPTKPRSRTEIV